MIVAEASCSARDVGGRCFQKHDDNAAPVRMEQLLNALLDSGSHKLTRRAPILYIDIGAMVPYVFTYRDSRTIRML